MIGDRCCGANLLSKSVMSGFLVLTCGLLLGNTCDWLPFEPDDGAVAEVEVTPVSASLETGGTQRFAAVASDSAGVQVGGTFNWSATGGTIDAEGLYRAGEVPGVYRVIATESSGVADTATVGLSMMGSDLVSDVSPASYQLGRLTVGERYYTDRDYTVRDVSAQFEDWVLIRTANADKNNGSASFLSFDLSATATVAVAYDKRATSLPGWLAEWTSAGSGLTVSDGSASPMPIRVRSFPAGRVVLGGNSSDGAAGAQSMYVVFVMDTAVSGGEDPVLTTVEVVPASATLQTHETRHFEAVARDQYGAPMAGSFSWTATGGTITAEGWYAAGGVPGTYQVVATESSGLADTANVTVRESGSPGTGYLTVHPDDPHYFAGPDGKAIFLLGGGVDPYDWFVRDSRFASGNSEELYVNFEENKLTVARIALTLSGDDDFMGWWPYERTGPGTARDGGAKWDLTKLSRPFFDRLVRHVAWAEANGTYVQVSLLNGIAFKSRGDNSAWEGSVYNPANRVNTQAGSVSARGSNPSMYDLFNSAANWGSDADRRWLRDRVKALIDEVLRVLAPYNNWWIEIGNESDGNATWKQYWVNYVKGLSHSIDDGAVSPYADTRYLVGDNSDFGGNVVSLGIVESQQEHHATAANAASKADAMYSDGIVAINDTDGSSSTAKTDRQQNRRMAWISLTHGGHFHNHNGTSNKLTISYMEDFGRLVTFVTTDRGGYTIEEVLPSLEPDQSIVTGGHALKNRTGQRERYLVFATAGNNPSVTIATAGLTIIRINTTTGVVEDQGVTTAGANTLVGSEADTAWWIE